ncbi:hypothetical protein Gohar_026516 [Gossypium harknessii]|uniref:Uncharacterized protein n=1 Tax=Gossypium harknessii TaxID=34285 RepID=A0A7J9HT59_9ROSI|nr:hypothetical protein [Gossypium harknessii]
MGVEVHDHHPGMVSHLALRASFKEMVVGSKKKGVLDIQENDEDDVQLLKEDFTVGNDYFLIKLQSEEDYVRALTEGLCVIKSIREMIGRVIKLDDNTESAQRGRFARLAVVLDLNKALISRIKESCYKPSKRGRSDEDIGTSTSNAQPQVQGEKHDVAEKYGPWMLVDQCPRKSDQKTGNGGEETTSFKRSRFNALTTLRDNDSAENHVLKLVNLKGKGLAVYGNPLGGEDSNVEYELLHVNGLDRLGQTNEPSKKTQHRGSLSKILSGPMISPDVAIFSSLTMVANGRALVHKAMNKIAERLGANESPSTSDMVEGVSSGTVRADTASV